MLPHRVLRPLLTGGVLYSVGAVLNLLHWPVIWPGVFRAHELFHLFVMAGSQGSFQLRQEILRRVNLVAAPAKVNAVLIEEMLVN